MTVALDLFFFSLSPLVPEEDCYQMFHTHYNDLNVKTYKTDFYFYLDMISLRFFVLLFFIFFFILKTSSNWFMSWVVIFM